MQLLGSHFRGSLLQVPTRSAHPGAVCASLSPLLLSHPPAVQFSVFFWAFSPSLAGGGHQHLRVSIWGHWGPAAACPHAAWGSPGTPGPLAPLHVVGIQGARCGSVPTPQHAGPLCISFCHLGGFHPRCCPSPPARGCELTQPWQQHAGGELT